MRADINTIATECGVSKATVSRVFTGKASVSKNVREKVLNAARKLNYAPQQVATRETIAIIVNSLENVGNENSFGSILLIHLIAEMTRSNFNINIIEAADIDKLLGSYTKAAVVIMEHEDTVKYQNVLKSMQIPLISIAKVLDNCHSICCDYYAEIITAMEYLTKNNHTRIGLILDNSHNRVGCERQRAYEEYLIKENLPLLNIYTYHPQEQSMIELIAIMLQETPTAMIICGESLVNEAAYAFNLLQVKIPDELSVISFENCYSSRWLFPAHTTINQNVLQMVKESIKLIKKLINQKTSQINHVTFPHKLIIRNSVKKLTN